MFVTSKTGSLIPLTSVKALKPLKDGTTLILLLSGESIKDPRTTIEIASEVHPAPTEDYRLLADIIKEHTQATALEYAALDSGMSLKYAALDKAVIRDLKEMQSGIFRMSQEVRSKVSDLGNAVTSVNDSAITLSDAGTKALASASNADRATNAARKGCEGLTGLIEVLDDAIQEV